MGESYAKNHLKLKCRYRDQAYQLFHKFLLKFAVKMYYKITI
jgi:hypothetical protein